MTRHWWKLSLAASLLLMLLVWACNGFSLTWQRSTDLEVEFVVSDESNGRPVARAQVELWPEDRNSKGVVLVAGNDGIARKECRSMSFGTLGDLRFTDTFHVHMPWPRYRAIAVGYEPSEWDNLNGSEPRWRQQMVGPGKAKVIVPVLLKRIHFPDGLNADDVLARMAKVYAECSSYRDTGIDEIVWDSPLDNPESGIDTARFETVFARPDRFRYEWTRSVNGTARRHIAWQSGEELQEWPSQRLKAKSLKFALLDRFSVHSVAPLLLPTDCEWDDFRKLTEANRVEDSKIDAVECFRIVGNCDARTTLWIEKTTFLLRRVEQRNHDWKDFGHKRTTMYAPLINDEIPDAAFEFAPPAAEKAE